MTAYEKCEERNQTRVQIEREVDSIEGGLTGDRGMAPEVALALSNLLLVRAMCLVAEEIHFKPAGGE